MKSDGNSFRAYCYAELAVSFLAVAVTIAGTFILPTHVGMARLSWPVWLGRIRRRYTHEWLSVE